MRLKKETFNFGLPELECFKIVLDKPCFQIIYKYIVSVNVYVFETYDDTLNHVCLFIEYNLHVTITNIKLI